ncbi:MAG: MtrAB system histidine kinase MtrB [Actinomycetaceae bacterium]|nr:MtrAB system histidine kinase MtrB [Actinomycetaceae bacterium]
MSNTTLAGFSERVRNSKPVLFIRKSLFLQVAAGMTAMMFVVLSLLFIAVTFQVRENIFDQRREQILDDASVRIAQAQSTFDQSTATTPDQVQDLANQLVSSLRSSATGAGAVGTMLMRSPSASTTFAINDLIDQNLLQSLSAEMRARTSSGAGPYYQSIAIQNDEGDPDPGIIVGGLVTLPLAGEYELYTVYTLRDDQETIWMLSRTLAVGSIPVIMILALGTVWVVFRLLRPVRTTAEAAIQLADGDLSVRVQADGIDEMSQLARAFNTMAESLSDKITEYDELSRLEQRFVSDVSHELRTPMTTIRMAEELLYDNREDFSPVAARSAELLHQQVDRFEKMLADLLEISRYDSKSASLEIDEVNFNELVAKVVDANQPLVSSLGVEVRVIASDPRCVAEADSRRMERVLRNFLVNAVEHAEQGPVEIEIAANADATSVRVRDYGIGMDEETSAHVFERFFRADPARTRTTGGTGLGLSIAREDVFLHGGRIEAYGELGKGAAFMVTIPRRQGTELAEAPLELWEEK